MGALLSGRATSAATSSLARRVSSAVGADGARVFGSDGHRHFRDLTVSSIGIGTYLGAADDATDRLYEAALARALAIGINVIDTAINYRCQRSERAVGRVLAAAFAAG